jgi:hypothetical protein
MDQLASKLNIKEPNDWARVTAQKMIDNGGGSLLDRYQQSVQKGNKRMQ